MIKMINREEQNNLTYKALLLSWVIIIGLWVLLMNDNKAEVETIRRVIGVFLIAIIIGVAASAYKASD